MLDNIEVIHHSTIKFNKEKVIYIDPYKIDKEPHDADLILITHSHYDHYSLEDINKIIKNDTMIIAPESMKKDINNNFSNILYVNPNNTYNIDNVALETVNSYNINKEFHPKQNNWVGYIITIDNIRYYVAGDTDVIDEAKIVRCDVAFVPIGGTFTMDYKEAAQLINIIKPKICVPIHYGMIVGKYEDAINFRNSLDNIKCEIMIKYN